ncbi:MAG: hypothetical protein IT326_09435 [Anaerolineae bacterium]|nr:hypothetical protein [Anaerolineae bacterium]
MTASRPIHFAAWNIILDDIVWADGSQMPNVLGGGGMYATVGMRLWTPNVGLQAKVGRDFDLHILDRIDVDTSGVIFTDLPTPHGWEIYEPDGYRRSVPQLTPEQTYEQLCPALPPEDVIRQLKGYHFQSYGDPWGEEVADAMIEAGVFVGAEPTSSVVRSEERVQGALRAVRKFEMYSPNEMEAVALVGERPELDTLKAIADLGPRFASVRLGPHGSAIYDRDTGEAWHVPAVPIQPVDLTGAGNSYVGALIVGIVEGHGLLRTAAQAAVSASFVIEQFGPPTVTPELLGEAQRRVEALLREARPLA